MKTIRISRIAKPWLGCFEAKYELKYPFTVYDTFLKIIPIIRLQSHKAGHLANIFVKKGNLLVLA